MPIKLFPLCAALLISVSLVACQQPVSTSTLVAIPTVAPTRSLTPRPSETAVATQSPTISLTASVEPTWMPQPTSTLLVSTPVASERYQLTMWTPEKAEQLITQLNNYPETLSITDRGYLDSGYFVAHQYEGLTELESALRFPHLDQGKTWQWDGAYNLYRSSNNDIASLYAGLISNALNQGETSLEDLETWFAKAAPFDFDTYPVLPPKGYQKSIILHIHQPENGDFSGGLAIWLVQKEGTFYSYPLKNDWEIAYGDGGSKAEVVDITGDGVAEAIIQNVDWGSFGMHSGDMAIYRLDQVPPREITFDVPPPDPSIAEWSVDRSQPVPTITFQVPVSITSDQPCGAFSAGWQYQWQAGELKFIRFIPPPMEEMEQDPFCTSLLVSTLGSWNYLENQSAYIIYKQLLELPFIERIDMGRMGVLSIEPERFLFALYLSNHSDDAGANEQIERIKAGTDPSRAEWRKNALAFFAARRDPRALLQFCLTTKKCADFLSYADLIALVPPSRFSEIETLLLQMGTDFSASGSYDFDQDGQVEKWLFYRNTTGCGNNFWILAKNADGIKSRMATALCLQDKVQAGEKVNITPLQSSGGLPAYQVSVTGQEQDADKFLYWPLDQKDPTIDTTRAGQMIDALQNKLLLKQISPAGAQEQIEAIQHLPLQLNRWLLPRFQAHLLYLLGLTQELNGQHTQAAQTYLILWQTYPDNPYAIMAFSKLEPVP